MMGDLPSELDLMAYADGELDGAASERLRQHLVADAKAAAKVKFYQQLRAAGFRACSTGMVVPASLHARIEGMVKEGTFDERGYRWPSRDEGVPSDGATERRSHEGKNAVWTAPKRGIGVRLLAAAALLVIGVGSVFLILSPERGLEVVKNSPLMTVGLVHSTTGLHAECSKHASHFGPGFPKKVEELPASLRQYIGHDAIIPDLTKLGYSFAGAGPCQIPGGKTAHLLYRPISGGNVSLFTISLFVQGDTGQLALDKGKVYFAADSIDKTPMIVWRENGVVYYLVGENNNQISDAARQIGMKVRI